MLIDSELYDGTRRTTLSSLYFFFTEREGPSEPRSEKAANSPQITLKDSLSGFRAQQQLTANLIEKLQ